MPEVQTGQDAEPEAGLRARQSKDICHQIEHERAKRDYERNDPEPHQNERPLILTGARRSNSNDHMQSAKYLGEHGNHNRVLG